MGIRENIFHVSEYFESIQGEGNYAGANSLFIRFHFCNLTCTWCDSKFTWFGNERNFTSHSAGEIRDIIAKHQNPHVIFTGGEPSLYRLDQLMVPGKKFHVETNGTFIPTEPVDITLKNTPISRDAMDREIIESFNWVVSPKLSNSRQPFDEHSFLYWVDKDFSIFKFVVRNTEDIQEVDALREKYAISKHKIYLSLEGITLESQLKPGLVDEIIRSGYNFSPRLHVILWGNQRGK